MTKPSWSKRCSKSLPACTGSLSRHGLRSHVKTWASRGGRSVRCSRIDLFISPTDQSDPERGTRTC